MNNFATTEAEIVEMGMRLAGAGAQIGLTEAQIMAFATALSSVGIAAEMGGSAFSKVMVDMQLASEQGGERLKAFAKVAGMSAEEFKKSFEQDATKAISAFLKGLATAEERGKSAIAILDEMDIKEVRLRDTLLRAAGAYDVFNNAVELSNKAWEENTALTAEAEQRYATTESRLKILWNRLKDVAISFGESLAPAIMDALDAAEPFFRKIEEGAKVFSELTKEEQQSILKTIGLVAAIGPASIAVGGLSKGIGGLLSVGSQLTKLFGSSVEKGSLLGRIAGLGKGGVVGLAIAGVTALGFAIHDLATITTEEIEANFRQLEAKRKQIEETDNLIQRYEELERKNRLSNDEMLRLLDIQSELDRTSTPELIESLQTEYDKLMEKSGLSNEEMNEFIELNGKIIELTPQTTKSISEHGNAWAENTEELRKYNELQKQSLLTESFDALQTAIDKHTNLLQKYENTEKRIKELHDEQIYYYQTVLDLNEEIADIEEEIKNLSGEQAEERRKSLEAVLAERKQQRKLADDMQKSLLDEIQKKQTQLGQYAEELQALDETKYKYEAIVLSIAGVTAERGKGLEKINEEIAKLEKQKELEKELLDLGKSSTTEYNNQITHLNEQIGRLENAKKQLEDINRYAGKEIFKVSDETLERVRKINRELSLPIQKTINFHIPRGYTLAPAYKDGTGYHPGGKAIVGEEGPELARIRNRWALLDFGIWDLPRGTQVIPHAESMKILNAIKRIPTYADGIGSQGTVNRILGQLESQQTVTPKQSAIIQLVTPDRRVFAEWLVDDITDMQNFKQARMKLFAT